MNKLLLAGVVLVGLGTGCSKKRIAECDDFAATVDKIAKCDKLPAESRKEIENASKTMKDALQMIDDAGGVGDAPQDLVKQLRDTCKTQQKTIVDEFSKLAPDCVK